MSEFTEQVERAVSKSLQAMGHRADALEVLGDDPEARALIEELEAMIDKSLGKGRLLLKAQNGAAEDLPAHVRAFRRMFSGLLENEADIPDPEDPDPAWLFTGIRTSQERAADQSGTFWHTVAQRTSEKINRRGQ